MERDVERGVDWVHLPVIATVARLLCRELTPQNEYLLLENRTLKSRIPGRLRFTDEERRSLAVWLLGCDGTGLARSSPGKHGPPRTAPGAVCPRYGCSYPYVRSMSDPAGLVLPPVRHPMVERRQSGRFHCRVTRTGGSTAA